MNFSARQSSPFGVVLVITLMPLLGAAQFAPRQIEFGKRVVVSGPKQMGADGGEWQRVVMFNLEPLPAEQEA